MNGYYIAYWFGFWFTVGIVTEIDGGHPILRLLAPVLWPLYLPIALGAALVRNAQ